jgi:hypothetical protein
LEIDTVQRPEPTEHIPYFERYIALVPEGNILDLLENQLTDLEALVAAVPESQAGHRYAPGKWSLREVLGHLVDTERILAYRAFSIARGETQPLNGYEPEEYAVQSEADGTSMRDLLAEFEHVRRGNIAMFRRLSGEAWKRVGTASGHPISVRALAYIMVGHIPHHFRIIREQYGVSF